MMDNDPRHGTNAGYKAHLAHGSEPCFRCRVASAHYRAHVYRETAYGRWRPWVDAGPVREHVERLMGEGMSIQRIADAAGVARTRVSALVYGSKRRPVPLRVRPDYASALLSVQSNPRLVPVFRAARRLQALIALGHSQAVLSERLGITRAQVDRIVFARQENVTEERFAAIQALYGELSMTLPPRRTKNEKFSASKALNSAERQGYAPPLAWSEEGLDDPNARPYRTANGKRKTDVDPVAVERAMAGDRIQLTRDERYEVVARLRNMGRSLGWIEEHTVITKAERYIEREAS